MITDRTWTSGTTATYGVHTHRSDADADSDSDAELLIPIRVCIRLYPHRHPLGPDDRPAKNS